MSPENGRKPRSDFTIIGSGQRKVDGAAKASGRALFTDDIELPGMLHGKILRSPHPTPGSGPSTLPGPRRCRESTSW